MIRTNVVPTQRTMELVFGCCRLASRAQAAADAFKLTKTHDIPLSLRAYNELLLAIAVRESVHHHGAIVGAAVPTVLVLCVFCVVAC